MGMVAGQYQVFLVELDPTEGLEIRKTRPCLVISPDEMNRAIGTVIVAPMTTASRDYPTRIRVEFGGKTGWIVLDQIRTIDRSRLVKQLGAVEREAVDQVKAILKQMLVD